MDEGRKRLLAIVAGIAQADAEQSPPSCTAGSAERPTSGNRQSGDA